MISETVSADVASEFLALYAHMEKKITRKIPLELIFKLQKIRNKEHKISLKKGADIKEQELMPETLSFVSHVFYKYVATDREKEKIDLYKEHKKAEEERLKREKYDPAALFNNPAPTPTVEEIKVEEISLVPVEEETFFGKIISFFKNLFGGKK